MGFFGSDTPKVFKNKDEIRAALMDIHSLDYNERPQVLGALIRELDAGGVTKLELREVVRELRKNHVISEMDEENILNLIPKD